MAFWQQGSLSYRFVGRIIHGMRFLVRALPGVVAAKLGATLGGLCVYFFHKDTEVAVTQIAFASARCSHPNFNKHKIQANTLAKKMFMHLGECIAEILIADTLFEIAPGENPDVPWAPNFKNFTFKADIEIKKMLEDQSSALALSAHLGCFELLAPFYSRIGFIVSVLRRAPNYNVLHELQKNFLVWGGTETIWRHEKQAIRKLLACFRDQKRIIAGLIDQDSNLENAFAPFFGLDAALPVAPVRLAIKNKLPILTTFIVRTKHLHHHVVVETIPYDLGDPDAELKVLTEYNRRLEVLICEYPEQWLWWHRRWRRRPGVDYVAHQEQLRGTKAYLEWLGALTKDNSLEAHSNQDGIGL